ncbi:MAG: protein translocase subunit SecF [Acidobacteria bacterium]|nr:protein translocase subunit SecF [Acidobacteriota bacterium]MBV9184232.1 protein translocase subunit SecF [Acidobacteriota bacterium]
MQIFVNSKYDFVKWRFYAVSFSVLFMLLGLAMFLKHGVNWGIDFAGGATITLRFKDAVPMDRLRADLTSASIQQYGKADDHAVLIRLPELNKETDYAGQVVAKLNADLNPQTTTKLDLNFHGKDRLTELLAAADPDAKGTSPAARDYYKNIAQNIVTHRSELGVYTNMAQVTSTPGVTTRIAAFLNDKCFLGAFNVLDQETVGPQVGHDLQQKAILAVVLSTLAMGLYLWIRFDLMFGASAIVCIVHDVLMSLAFLMMINGEFSLNIVAALLLIVGFSINDTVVMYDRVRENRRKLKTRMNLEEQLNLAMNQTLSRTILTSGSVVIVLVALILFGGKVIHEFAWILLIGVLAGTYSTVTIVPAVAIAWNNMTGRKHDLAGPANRPTRVETKQDVPPAQRKRRAG